MHPGPVTFYAELPGRRIRQVLGDIGLIVWAIAWIRIAVWLHELVMNLAAPGLALASGGQGLADSIDSAGSALGGIPLVGSALQAPFEGMTGAAQSLADAGQAEADAVGKLALALAVVIAALAICLYVAAWVPWRIMFIRRATAAKSLVDADADLDLFALRAMARQPLHVLARISADPAGAWRAQDPAVVRALAALELKSEGLRLPAAP